MINIRELIEQATPAEGRSFFADVPVIIHKYNKKQALAYRMAEQGIEPEQEREYDVRKKR